jgi:hypothetical protein
MDLSAAAALFRNTADSALFVTSQLRPRELKMADGLRQLGWKVGLIYYKWTPFEPNAYFDFCFEAETAQAAHQIAKHLSPRVSHVFSGAIDDLILMFCRDKPSPVVIDLNDVFAPSLFNYCEERFEPTREALALADGFCARDLQVKSAERLDGFRLPQKLLLFPEYCWNGIRVPDALAERADSDDVHVVSVGTFSLETQGMYDSCYLRLTEMLVEHGIHFHIYPHWAYRRDHLGSPHVNFERDFSEFLALQSTNPYLHVHDSLSIEELGKVLPRYDFGMVSGGCASFGQHLKFYHRPYIENCYSGRISDYLDARLPILVNDEVKFDYWLLKRYGACVDLKGVLRPGFKQNLLDRKRDKQKRKVVEYAAQRLSVKANSPRLATFYQSIIASETPERLRERKLELHDGQAKRTLSTEMPISNLHQPRRLLHVARLMARHLRQAVRWTSPRAAKILLPYRAIRIFQVRLHNSLQENESSRLTIAGLRARLDEIEHELATANSELDDRRRNSDEALVLEASLRTEGNLLKANNLELQLEVARLDSAATELRLKADELREGNGVLQGRAAQLIRDLAEMRVQLGDLLQSNSALVNMSASLRAEHAALQDDNSSLRRMADDSHATIELLRTQLAGQMREGEILRGQIAAQLQSNSSILSLSSALQAENTELRRENSVAMLQGRDLEVSNSLLRTQLSQMGQEVATALSRNATLDAESAILRDASESMRAELQRLASRTEKETLISAATQMASRISNVVAQDEANFAPTDPAAKILLACMPKSGSTWLTSILADRLGLPPVRCYLEADRNEQELDATVLFQTWGKSVLFVQQHIRYSRIMLRLCKAFSTKIVVLTRRLDDVVVSLRDHVEHQSAEVSMFYMEPNWFKTRSSSEQIDFIIDHAMPWYLNFFVGWQRAMLTNKGQILQIRYEDMVKNTSEVVDRIASFYGASTGVSSPADLDKRIGTRFNQGRVGRGKEVLSKAQIARLRRLASYYPDCDFESIGL